MRIPEFLTAKRVPFDVLVHPPAYSAQRRAGFLHVPGKNVVKAVVLRGPHGPFIAVLPATHHVNLDRLSIHFGGFVHLETPEHMHTIFTDCEFGVANPFGKLYGLPTILDHSVDRDATIAFQGHTHFQTIRISCRDYERVERPHGLLFAVRFISAAA